MNSKLIFFNTLIFSFIVVIILSLADFISKKFAFDTYYSYFISLLIIFAIIFIIGHSFIEFLLEPIFKRNELLNKILKDTLHELNIPIASIKANVAMLNKNIENEKDKKRLQRIEKAIEKLLVQYENLDYYIKKEIRKITKEVFDIKEIIDEEILNFELISKEIKLINNTTSFFIYADKNGFTQIITNLISNAIKYNKIGGFVEISIQNNNLFIKDSGIGMDEIEIIKIFDRYYQGNSFQNGHGIGLNIVKYFCDEHKIKINLNSKKNIGTEFILDLINIKVK